jgi:AmmeMemoRadiSam system protein A
MVEKVHPANLARKTVEHYISNKEMVNPADYKVIDVEVDQAGAFVCLKTKDGELRGCIGTIFPTKKTVEEEIVANAISASTGDPRFAPVNKSEIDDVTYSVDILHNPEPVGNIAELDPKVYGIIVKSESGKQALLLPDLEGVNTVEDQVAITKRKAGIPMNEPVHIFRFKVDRYDEKE